MNTTVHYSEYKRKIVFVTGAASGIGLAQARAFLAQDAFVFAFDCQERQLKILKEQYPISFAYFTGDVCQPNDLSDAVEQCTENFGSIDILLNTVGILDDFLPLLETEEELFDRLFEVNVKSFFRLTQLVLPTMLAKKQGVILSMSSIAGFVAGGGGMAYTMSKHAIVGFIKQLALDYADQGIQVCGMAPGAIQTPMNAADFMGEGEMAKKVAAETPVKRWAQPEEVANVTLFLASQQASYMQGSIVTIDGGWTLK